MGSKKSSPPPAPPTPSPAEQAIQVEKAKEQLDPAAAQRDYNILASPDYGLLPTTRLFENVRTQVFPQETNVRNQLATNILANLTSPTGISAEQQSALDARRALAQNELVRAIRERSQLGGKLYGGQSQQLEARSVGELQNQFSEADIAREERARLNSIQAALPFLQILFPDVNLTPPQFQSPVQSPDTYASALTQQRGQDMGYYNQQLASRAAQQSALYQALGNVGASVFGGLSPIGSGSKKG